MSSRPLWSDPFVSKRIIFSGSPPAMRIRRAIVVFDAPAPFMTIRTLFRSLPTIRSALIEAGQRDAARALGVVVPYRNLALLAQRVEHLVAVRLRDVLEVDGAEAGLHHLHEIDDLVGIVPARLVVAVDAQGDAVHAAEVLHQERLPLHHAQAAGGRAVAVAEHARGVAHDSDQVAPVRQLERRVGLSRIVVDTTETPGVYQTLNQLKP